MLAKSIVALFLSALVPAALAVPAPFAPDALTACPKVKGSLIVDSFTINPPVLVPGKDAVFTASGEVTDVIVKGAKVKISAKLGIIPVYNSELDICEETEKVGIPCPIEAGKRDIVITKLIPDIMPSGTFNLKVEATNANGKPIVCYTGSIQAKKA
ncbi:ML domain-containing protein [Phlyctochytrium arcticum]|nr:ML domain-containing protein [Phlyctochytrium arcticum]